jgi:dienelactone hydrolase
MMALGVVLAACSALGQTDAGADLSQPGPYAVGLALKPISRTLPSGETRTVNVYFRYPVNKQARASGPLPEMDYTAGAPAAHGGPFPLVVFSHGYGLAPSYYYSSLMNYLASHGFVVAAPSHEDCTQRCTAASYQADRANRPADVSMVLDTLLALNDGDDPVFRALVDPERVGVAGQSLGGWTTLTVLERDPRFRAGLAISPGIQSVPSPDPGKVSRPLLVMGGVLDSLVPYGIMSNFFTSIPASAPDHYVLAVQRAGHQFGDACVDFLVTTSCEASLPQPELIGIVNRFGTAFLKRYVAGQRVTDAQLGLQDRTDEYVLVKAPSEGVAIAPTAAPLQAAAPATVTAGTVLLQDSLTDGQTGALPASSLDPGRYRAGYVPGGYEIGIVKAPGTGIVWGETLLPGSYANASLAVDVEMANPLPSQYVQLACRSRNANTQYRLGFRPATGEVWINRWFAKDGFDTQVNTTAALPLTLPASFPSTAHLGGDSNHIELRCNGTTITGHLNGATVASASDNSIADGQMWIAVGETGSSTAGGGTHPVARFSNLVVKQE